MVYYHVEYCVWWQQEINRALVTQAESSHWGLHSTHTINEHLHFIYIRMIETRETPRQYIHKLKRQGIGYTLQWEILKKAPPWNPITNICRLCILEKHHILFYPEDASLNQRSEFFTICRHKEKHLLMKSWTAFLFLKLFTNKAFSLSFCSSQSNFNLQYLFFLIFFHLSIYM